MQPTTALRRIAALRKKIKGVQGGQGAGKTFAILMLLINHASSKRDKEIFIASDELSKMRITVIKDFINIMKAFNIFNKENFVDGTLYRFPNNSFIKFIGLDKADIGKGLRCDVMFVNEANKIKFDTYRELTSRAKQIFIDFNPNKKFWFHNEVLTRDDCDFLKLTYLDNEFLSKEELGEILRYKQRGYNDKGEIINPYWANMWNVYGLGEIGQVEGRIYTWQPIALDKYLSIEKKTYYGCDWGKVDPWAITELKYHDGNLYVHELNYASENELERNLSATELHQIKAADIIHDDGEVTGGLMTWMFSKLKIPKNNIIVCDSNRPNKILSLRRAGWEYAIGVGGKSRLIDRIGILSSLNIYYTNCSKNIEYEQENYCYAKDKYGAIQEEPVDQDNHTIDSIAYPVQYMFNEGIIKNV
jgi:phage terminase large subunit